MKPHIIFFLLLFIIFAPSYSQEGDKMSFPDDFFGIYSGPLEITSNNGNQSIDMEFHLKPTDSVGKYEYKLVYIANGNRQERDYTLIEQNKESGQYIVDENNGIILDDKVVGNKMYALFEVNGTLLTTFITFGDDQMVFEIVATNTKDKRITHPKEDPNTEVISYPISTVQRAVLQKQ